MTRRSCPLPLPLAAPGGLLERGSKRRRGAAGREGARPAAGGAGQTAPFAAAASQPPRRQLSSAARATLSSQLGAVGPARRLGCSGCGVTGLGVPRVRVPVPAPARHATYSGRCPASSLCWRSPETLLGKLRGTFPGCYIGRAAANPSHARQSHAPSLPGQAWPCNRSAAGRALPQSGPEGQPGLRGKGELVPAAGPWLPATPRPLTEAVGPQLP